MLCDFSLPAYMQSDFTNLCFSEWMDILQYCVAVLCVLFSLVEILHVLTFPPFGPLVSYWEIRLKFPSLCRVLLNATSTIPQF